MIDPGVVRTAVNLAAEWITIPLEAGGNTIADLLPSRSGPARWLSGTVCATSSLLAALVKAGLGVVAGLASGVLNIATGRVTRGLSELAASLAGAVIVVGGKAIAVVQAMLGMQWHQRPLTAAEQRLLRQVFGRSVDLRAVRVVPGFAGVFGVNPRPFTLGNTIYLKKTTEPATLVHECVHVWQHQHEGVRYTAEALWAQATISPSAYRWQDELARGRGAWPMFNKEAQAQFIEDVFRFGRRSQGGTPGEFFAEGPAGSALRFTRGGTDHSGFAADTIARLRSARRPRMDRRHPEPAPSDEDGAGPVGQSRG